MELDETSSLSTDSHGSRCQSLDANCFCVCESSSQIRAAGHSTKRFNITCYFCYVIPSPKGLFCIEILELVHFGSNANRELICRLKLTSSEKLAPVRVFVFLFFTLSIWMKYCEWNFFQNLIISVHLMSFELYYASCIMTFSCKLF